MDTDLDLALVPTLETTYTWTMTDVLSEFPQAEKLTTQDFVLENGQLWSKWDDKVYLETQLVVPTDHMKTLVETFHMQLVIWGLIDSHNF